MTTLSLADKLRSCIDNASSVYDLDIILSTLPVQLIKNLIKEYIETLKISECAAIASKACPMTDILNANILQYILAFNISPEINSVNKLFNQLSVINEHVFLNKQLDAKYKSVQTIVNKHQLQYLKFKRLSLLTKRSITKANQALTHLKERQRNIDQRMDEAMKASCDAYKSVHIQEDEQNNQSYDQYFAPSKSIKYITGFSQTYLMQPLKRRTLSNDTLAMMTELVQDQRDRRCSFPIRDFVGNIPSKSGYNTISFNVTDDTESECDFTESKCKELGYNGPHQDLKDVVSKRIKSCDKILLTDGVYDLQKHNFKDVDLQFIGLGDNVILRCNWNTFFSVSGNSNIYFENIKFDSAGGLSVKTHIRIEENSSLWLNKCSVIFARGRFITSSNDANLYIKNCKFAANGVSKSTLVISPWAKNANIINCIFENCSRKEVKVNDGAESCYSCIQIEDGYESDYSYRNPTHLVNLKCIGNTFINNFGFTMLKTVYRDSVTGLSFYQVGIAEREEEDWFDKFDEEFYVLEDNVLKGANGLDVEEVVNDANKMYQEIIPE